MDPQECRDRFARHLAEETELLTALEQQLVHEHELLVTNDIEGLESVGTARQQTIARLLRVHDERGKLCKTRGLTSDAGGFAALLAWCDPQGSMAAAQGECATHAQRCREQNERNGALVTARLKRVGGMLGMITGESAPNTYQSRTSARSPAYASAGRMLSTSA
jgi:flagellar biosynthesis protein FlgN